MLEACFATERNYVFMYLLALPRV